ncbi:MAG: hypothetical protein ACYC5G_04065 [Candidatus Doudnabacteria bacterium]
MKECRYYSTDSVFVSPYRDWDGNETERTPDEYRYSYDPYVQYKKKDEYQHTVYSDRLFQWDCKKHDDLCQKHFGNRGQYWDNRPIDKIESFLRDYYNKQDLVLVGKMEGCNVSNGYPYWILMFDCKFD